MRGREGGISGGGKEVYEGEGSATDENQIFHKGRSPGILTVKLLKGFSSRTIKKGCTLNLKSEKGKIFFE